MTAAAPATASPPRVVTAATPNLVSSDMYSDPDGVKLTPDVSYTQFLKLCPPAGGVNGTAPPHADPVSFLRWALIDKLGSPDAFEHRRRELAVLHALSRSTEPSVEAMSDAAVARSFFRAAQPGGVYYDYLQLGRLAVVLDGILFVHGGVNAHNIGFVPDADAPFRVQTVDPDAPESQRELRDGNYSPVVVQMAGRRLQPQPRSDGAADGVTEWVRQLDAFKTRCLDQWARGEGNRGEPLRFYAVPRRLVPCSITVGSFIFRHGPRFAPLETAKFLAAGGVTTVCSGHQPVGDAPVSVRQPGGFLMVDGDNSYCGRGNRFCHGYNGRGKAVTAMVFNEDGAGALRIHGTRADGRAFDYDGNDPLLGRHCGEGWWVKLPPQPDAPPESREGKYLLHRTRDSYRTEEERYVTRAQLEAMRAAWREEPVSGEPPPRYSKAQLAYPHRPKTRGRRQPTAA